LKIEIIPKLSYAHPVFQAAFIKFPAWHTYDNIIDKYNAMIVKHR